MLRNLASDTIPGALDISYQDGSCAFWNLSSVTLTSTDLGGPNVVIEMAYDNQDGAPSWRPNNVNTHWE